MCLRENLRVCFQRIFLSCFICKEAASDVTPLIRAWLSHLSCPSSARLDCMGMTVKKLRNWSAPASQHKVNSSHWWRCLVLTGHQGSDSSKNYLKSNSELFDEDFSEQWVVWERYVIDNNVSEIKVYVRGKVECGRDMRIRHLLSCLVHCSLVPTLHSLDLVNQHQQQCNSNQHYLVSLATSEILVIKDWCFKFLTLKSKSSHDVVDVLYLCMISCWAHYVDGLAWVVIVVGIILINTPDTGAGGGCYAGLGQHRKWLIWSYTLSSDTLNIQDIGSCWRGLNDCSLLRSWDCVNSITSIIQCIFSNIFHFLFQRRQRR